jgi:hypothetical protein
MRSFTYPGLCPYPSASSVYILMVISFVFYIPHNKGETVDQKESVSWVLIATGVFLVASAIVVWRSK